MSYFTFSPSNGRKTRPLPARSGERLQLALLMGDLDVEPSVKRTNHLPGRFGSRSMPRGTLAGLALLVIFAMSAFPVFAMSGAPESAARGVAFAVPSLSVRRVGL